LIYIHLTRNSLSKGLPSASQKNKSPRKNLYMRQKGIPENFPFSELEKYIERKVLPAICKTPGNFHLLPTSLGNRNMLIFLTGNNFQDMVLKGFTQKLRLENSVLSSRVLTQHDINIPEVFFSDTSQRTFKQFAYYFCCEKKISGNNLDEITCSPEIITAVATFYARMHNINGRRWGRLTSLRRYGFTGHIREKIKTGLSRLNNTLPDEFDKKKLTHSLEWFEKKLKNIKPVKEFHMCHGDVNKKNIILSDSSQIFIIDNEAIKYLPFPIEFFRLKFILCRDDLEMQRVFEQAYFKGLPQEMLKTIKTTGLFYSAYVLLEFTLYFNKKIRQQNKSDSIMNDSHRTNRLIALNGLKDLTA
jgi:tRNA A-37 threonylcarbamoyl transferase component Bud32